MKCNDCGTHMKRALYNSEGWSERLVILDNYNPATGKYETTGAVVYCPKCGNMQVELERMRNEQRMIKIAKLATAHMFDENNPEDSDFELWKSIARYMDGEDAYVVESADMEGEYVFLGLRDKGKDKELAYMMEQDGMTGRFIGNREGFETAWESKEYEHDGFFYIKSRWMASCENLNRQRDEISSLQLKMM